MSLTLFHRHVLEDHLSGFETNPNPNHVAVMRRPAIFSVLAHRGHEASVRDTLLSIDGISVRDCGPGEWLVVSTTSASAVVENLLADLGGGAVIDQSDGRALLHISGPSVRRILAKCTAVDVHAEAFAVGSSTNTLFCHVPVNLARSGADAFEIVAPRSFCGSLYEELMEMGREFAMTASFADG